MLNPLARFTLAAMALTLVLQAAAPRVVFVTGDHEYGGESTMPALAKALEDRYGWKTTVLFATRPDGAKDENYEQNIPGLEALETADLAIFFLRWRLLPADQVAHIQKYLESGKPVMGFRTSSHSFHYPKGDPLEKWNAFGQLAFGTPPGWGADGHTHCGHNCSTDVSAVPGAASHPILTGIPPAFHVRSWLYRVLPKYPPADATQLLIGKALTPNKPMEDNPIAWTWKNQWGGPAFYTSIGHPEDFALEPVQRLAVNAMHWALGKPVPKKWKGKLDIQVPYHGIRSAK